MDVAQNSEGKLNYFGLTTSTNAYFTHDSGNSITNAGSLTGPNTLVGPGLQNPVKLPIPSSTITIDGQTYYFNYYVVQVVTEKVISPINEVQGNNYALQPLDTLYQQMPTSLGHIILIALVLSFIIKRKMVQNY